MFKTLIIPFFLAPLIACSLHQDKPLLQPTLIKAWTLDKSLSRPESVIYDKVKDILYVSNINGNPSKKDGNGYIAKVSLAGDVLDEKWVSGLNAPKGMTIVDNNLYVADIDNLVEISLDNGRVTNRYVGKSAKFLNDVSADAAGNVYVSDSKLKTIYRLSNGRFSVWISDDRISKPNGIFVYDDQLVVAAGDSKSKKPWRERFLQTINLKDKSISPLGDNAALGSLDGVEDSGHGGFFLSDFRSGDISYYTKQTGNKVIANPEKSTADIKYIINKSILYVPVLKTHKLIAYKVSWK